MAIRTWTEEDAPHLVVGGPCDGMVVQYLSPCKGRTGFFYKFPDGHTGSSTPIASDGTPKRITAEQANAIEVARDAHAKVVLAAKSDNSFPAI